MRHGVLAGPLLLGVLLASASAGVASSTKAASDSTALAPVSLVRALGRIPLTSRILLEATSPVPSAGARPYVLLEGALEHWDAHSLLIRRQAEEREIPLTSVQGLWVRGRATRHGAKLGAVTLGIFGAIAGPISVGLNRVREGGSDTAPQAGDYLEATLIGAAVGFVGGALVGGGIGAACHRWNRRFP
jgi:hypothetical protein